MRKKTREQSVKAKKRGKKGAAEAAEGFKTNWWEWRGNVSFFPLTPFLCSVALHAPSPLGSQVARLGTDGPPSLVHAGPAGPSKHGAAVVGGRRPDGDTKEGWTESVWRPGTFYATHRENTGQARPALTWEGVLSKQMTEKCVTTAEADLKQDFSVPEALILLLLLKKDFDPEVSAFKVFCKSSCALMAIKKKIRSFEAAEVKISEFFPWFLSVKWYPIHFKADQ